MKPIGRELVAYDWRVPDGLISKWLRHGLVSRWGVYRGLHKHGSFRLDLTLRKRVIAAKHRQPPTWRERWQMAFFRALRPRRRRFGLTRQLVWLGLRNWLYGALRPTGWWC